jgi:hypothetical protein
MGQPKHIRVIDNNGDVRDVVIPVPEIIASGAHRFLKTGDPADCAILDGRASPSSITGPTTRWNRSALWEPPWET